MPVYRREKKDWTKDGRSYYFRCYYTDIYGNRKQKKSKLFKGKAEARDAETDFLASIKINDETDKNILFRTIYNEWLELEKRRLKSTTYYSKKLRTNLHILNFFKDFKLHYIKISTINTWYKYLETLSIQPDFKNKLISDLKSILTYALNNYEFDRKIIANIIPFRIEIPKDKLTDAEINFWTYDEWNLFINTVNNNFYKLLYNFLYYTGLRFGEFTALNWTDYDPEEKNIKITKTLSTKVEGVKYKILDPKTENSVRIVDIDDELNYMLINYMIEEEKIYDFNPRMFMFGNIKYIAETTFRRHLKNDIANAQKIIKEKYNTEFKRITPHGFRHSHVSLLIYLGCDVYDVAKRIGDTVETVEKTYYHMFPKKKKETIKKLNKFKKTRPKQDLK